MYVSDAVKMEFTVLHGSVVVPSSTPGGPPRHITAPNKVSPLHWRRRIASKAWMLPCRTSCQPTQNWLPKWGVGEGTKKLLANVTEVDVLRARVKALEEQLAKQVEKRPLPPGKEVRGAPWWCVDLQPELLAGRRSPGAGEDGRCRRALPGGRGRINKQEGILMRPTDTAIWWQ